MFKFNFLNLKLKRETKQFAKETSDIIRWSEREHITLEEAKIAYYKWMKEHSVKTLCGNSKK
jgi:hypothetical protein